MQVQDVTCNTKTFQGGWIQNNISKDDDSTDSNSSYNRELELREEKGE